MSAGIWILVAHEFALQQHERRRNLIRDLWESRQAHTGYDEAEDDYNPYDD